jgi:hypothetical protein
MKKMKKYLSAIALVITFIACSPSMKVTSSWTNSDKTITANKTYKTVFISVITSKLELKTKLENDLAVAAQSHGYTVIKSIDKFPPVTASTNANNSKEEVWEIIKKSGADAILTTSIVDKTSETRYVPGSGGVYAPGFYGGYRGYYTGAWGYASAGYYTEDKTYFLESNLFDVATESTIWSCQSEAYNPTSIEKSSSQYTTLIIAKMQTDGLANVIKK